MADLEELRRQINNVIDRFADSETTSEPQEAEVVERKLPEGKRAVRTKSMGDRVYILDEVKKTRQWVHSNNPSMDSPELLRKLGWEMSDVVEINDEELLGYQMGPAIYRVDS